MAIKRQHPGRTAHRRVIAVTAFVLAGIFTLNGLTSHGPLSYHPSRDLIREAYVRMDTDPADMTSRSRSRH